MRSTHTTSIKTVQGTVRDCNWYGAVFLTSPPRSGKTTALETVDCVVIDEIAPMQLESKQFIRETKRALESSTPVLAAIKLDDVDDVLTEIKARRDTELVRIEPETHNG